MNIHIKQILILFLAIAASLFMLDAHAGKPVKVTVEQAIPNEAIQGDALPVRIKGTGFDSGSTVKFIVTDTKDDTQIEVGTVIYESDTGELVAHVKVKDQAQVIDYDVEVTTSSGRRGKGTTLFRVREREGQEDPCVNPVTFAPDFAFLRDTGRTKGRYKVPTEVTIFLAESFTGCEMSLVEIPIIEPVNQLRNLKFSSVEDENGYFGRVVWTSNRSITALSVWKQDFYVDGADVIPLGGPIEVLRNMLDDDPLTNENIHALDLSHDTRALVYAYWYSYPDPNAAETRISRYAVRILDIEPCVQPGVNSCGFGGLDNAVELDSLISTTSEPGGSFWYPSWGPLGNRIYVKKWLHDPVFDSYHALGYYDIEEDWQTLEWPPSVIYSDTVISDFGWDGDVITDYGWYGRVSSGIMDGVEYLAISDEFSAKTGGCEGIFIVEAEDCLVNKNCTTEPEIAGDYPSFTKDGTLIHAYDGWVPTGECGLDSVGYWDADGNLESLFDGYKPDAAGGIR
ncbi:MAG: hypothetical protein OQJ84_09985 [Xanthomonadales bacterium]|nr:hypothetical protein [Xanthomonadales bacterium]